MWCDQVRKQKDKEKARIHNHYHPAPEPESHEYDQQTLYSKQEICRGEVINPVDCDTQSNKTVKGI